MQFHVLRLLWLLPIFMLAGLFDTALVGAMFALCMSYASGKIFPVLVNVTQKETE